MGWTWKDNIRFGGYLAGVASALIAIALIVHLRRHDMEEQAKVCEHTETELKYDVDRGGHYVQCRGCGLSGPPQSEEGAARECWTQMLAWYPKRRAFIEAEQKRMSSDLGEALGIKQSLEFQAGRAEHRMQIEERHATASERSAAAFERIAAALETLAAKAATK